MDERLSESLSALMDNEADELEIERLLVRSGKDSELRATWLRYNMVRHSLQGQSLAHSNLDISEQVRSQLGGQQGSESSRPGLGQRVMRPLTSLAVAASVAATVVIGGQQLSQLGAGDNSLDRRPVAGIPLPAGLVNSQGAVPVHASHGIGPVPVLQPATRRAYDELAQRRLRRYMQEHAEQAALNSPQGLLPFARVPEIRE